MSFTFPKSVRLLNRRQYQRVARNHQTLNGKWVIIEKRERVPPSDSSTSYPTKLGITVTRKYGKSHERNRFKRLVREAFRLCRHQLPPNLELNVRPKQGEGRLTLHEIIEDLMSLRSTWMSPP